jgi:hypothetical protein
VEQLARDVLRDPVRVNVGSRGAMTSNEDIRQVVHVVPHDGAKWAWLTAEVSEHHVCVLAFACACGGAERTRRTANARCQPANAVCLWRQQRAGVATARVYHSCASAHPFAWAERSQQDTARTAAVAAFAGAVEG